MTNIRYEVERIPLSMTDPKLNIFGPTSNSIQSPQKSLIPGLSKCIFNLMFRLFDVYKVNYITGAPKRTMIFDMPPRSNRMSDIQCQLVEIVSNLLPVKISMNISLKLFGI